MTTALQLKREQMSLSKAELARRAGMQQGLIGWIESRRFIPYDSQLPSWQRLLIGVKIQLDYLRRLKNDEY